MQTRAGYLAVYQDAGDEADEGADEDEAALQHPVVQGQALSIVRVEARQSYARPPKRYNEATIVADLEKQGIGRPSTYASILRTIFARKYIDTGNVAGKKLTSQVLTWQNGQVTASQKSETLGADKDKLLPTATGTEVTEFLEQNFPKVMDYKFTAGCEAIFDKIAAGTQTYQQFVPMFDQNLLGWVAAADQLTSDRAELQKRLVGQFEGAEMLIGTGKNGPYILHAEKYYNIPEGVSPDTLSEAQAIITQRRQSAPRELGQHQGKPVVVGQGPKGVYLKWSEQYFNVPAGLTAAAITPALAINCIIKAQAESAKNVLATVGKYTIGKNEWGLYVSDGEVKAKFTAVSKLVYMISAMVKPIFGIVSGYPIGCSSNGLFEVVVGTCFGRAQPCFELAEREFNRVKIRRVRRQVAQANPLFFRNFIQAVHFMHRQVIEDHHIARPQGGPEDLVQVGRKYVPIDGPVHTQQGPEAVGGQRSDERHVWAAVQRHGLVQPLTARGTPVAATIGQVRTRLIHKHKTSNVFLLNLFEKQTPQGDYAFRVAFGGMDAFFLRPQSRRSTACHTAVRCNDGPPAATRAWPSSTSVASGCAPRQASSSRSPAASKRRAGPG